MARHLGTTKLLNGKSTIGDVGLIPQSYLTKAESTSIYIEFSAGASAGTVLIEGAASDTYAGTWAVLGTVNWSAASKVHNVAISGNHLSLRVRISGTITGGSVDAYAVVTG